MGITLVINPGSSSKKYALYNDTEQLLMVRYEKSDGGFHSIVATTDTQSEPINISPEVYRDALPDVLQVAQNEQVITAVSDITHIAVRVVAPGVYFQQHQVIDETFVDALKAVVDTVPLHIPPVLAEINLAQTLLPQTTLVGVSDSAFHATIPNAMAQYSLEAATDLEIRRYGYHGLSVHSIKDKLSSMLGTLPPRIVVAHIGSGVSITALKDGVSIYNSMGYTPASGIMMSSRAGDMDPGALIEVLKKSNTELSDAHRYLQTSGGFAGLLGVSDLRIVLEKEQSGDPVATTALEMFLFAIKSQIATAATALGGIDVLVLSATAMERNPDFRKRVLLGLEFLGITINDNANRTLFGQTGIISKPDNQVLVMLVPTDEMGIIAKVAMTIEKGLSD